MIKFLYKKIDHNDLDKKGFLKGKKKTMKLNSQKTTLNYKIDLSQHVKPMSQIVRSRQLHRKKIKKKLMPNSNNPNVKGQNKKISIDKKVPKKYLANSSKFTKPCKLDHVNGIT